MRIRVDYVRTEQVNTRVSLHADLRVISRNGRNRPIPIWMDFVYYNCRAYEESLVIADDGWVLAKGKNEGKPMFVRLRRFANSFCKADYPERVDITWEISKPDQHGLPSPAEMDRMEAFENALVQAVERDEHSVLAFTITTNGCRFLMFYTADVDGFLERLQTLPHPNGKYPISLACDQDSEWSYYSEFVR